MDIFKRGLLVTLAAALLAGAARAEQYIVLASGEVPAGRWTGVALVANPTAAPLHVQVTAVFPRAGTPPCDAPLLGMDIAPFDTVTLTPYQGACPGIDITAFVFEADRPVSVTNETHGASACPALQALPVPADWFPPNRDVVFTQVRYEPAVPGTAAAGQRVNFVIVNAEPRPLTLTYAHLGASAPEHQLLVAPSSLAIAPLTGDDFVCNDAVIGGVPVDRTCGVRVRADGRFYAGFSVIDNATNIAVFRTGLVSSD